MTTTVKMSELPSLAGQTLGTSDWVQVTQEKIDQFADATGDHQWIHVDRERAADGPFGTTIAHGYLTLSLLPMLVRSVYTISGAGMGINYGLNRARFPTAVPSGSRVRAEVVLSSVDELEGGAMQLVSQVTITAEGADKPACVAEAVARYYP
jgi:acyl dehydratase